MASLGNFLVTKVLGHSAAEKAFRPWWDNFEDFLVYGLVMLGLIVAPTALVNGTPLDCNLCSTNPCNYSELIGGKYINQTDPKFNMNWVKKVCTATAVDGFIVYFPFILLVMALVIILIERAFIRIFKAGLKLDTFYNLLVKEALENDALMTSSSTSKESNPSPNSMPSGGGPNMTTTTSIIPLDLENTKMAVEVSYSFKNSSSYFYSYLIRTLSETGVAAALLVWLVILGLPAIRKDEIIYCVTRGYHFECAGHPQEFYMYVLFITIAILFGYLLCCIYNLLWLIIPRMRSLSKVMNDYRREVIRQQKELGNTATDHQMLGNLYDVFYNNKDLQLLLNLLAVSSGISPSLRILTLFDKNFRSKMEPCDLDVSINPSPSDPNSKIDVDISFDDPVAIRNNFSKMKDVTTIYTIELIPPPPCGGSGVHVFKYGFDEEDDEGILPMVVSRAKNVRSKKITNDIELEKLKNNRLKRLRYSSLDLNQEYTIRVCTIVNGRAIARKIKRINSPTPTQE